jgi:two-component system sensor histidine kinase RpfC
MALGRKLLDTFLSPVAALRVRLRGRPDSEHEQGILRIVLVGLITIFMFGRATAAASPAVEADRILLGGLVGFFILALAIFGAICVWPASNRARRILGMVADVGGTTFALFLTGASGVWLVGVYLFVTFGNGFRYGNRYLFRCQALCLAGFGAVVSLADWWRDQPAIGWGLMISLLILPFYVSTLLKKIHEERSKAEEANKAKSSFLANMSHEMRTPLNGIVGVADLLQTTALSSEQSELMRLLRHSVVLLRSLVDDVLDISKIEAGRLTIEITDFDLYATLNSIVRMMRPHAVAKGLAVRAMVDPSIEYQVKGDPHHLRQVLVNLLSNAVKFTERGHIEMSASLLGETTDGLRVRFEVSDTGIGIAQEAQSKVFEQFVQADDSTTRRYGGTGLGTAIAKQLVELMGGAIGLRSSVGVGTTFWFDLPLLRSRQPRDIPVVEGQPMIAALLVADAHAAPRVEPLIAAACGGAPTVVGATAVTGQLRSLRQQGMVVSAVVVAGAAETACEVFEQIAAEKSDDLTAMIYLAHTTPSEANRQRLRSIDGATYLGTDASPRLLRNAIHAATSTDSRESAEIIDLALVLKQQRPALRILVAEDNATNQTIIRQLLETAGHTVMLANDGEEALDLYEAQHPDLAILDFNMPERSGVEVATAIRTVEPTGAHLPIVILSASVTKETHERARQAGADEFVGKPFDAASLLHVVDRLARRVPRDARTKSGQIATVSHAAIPLVDRARLREVELISSDRAFLGKLVRGFCADVDGMLSRLDASISSGQLMAVTDITHAITGASLGIGAAQLAARCSEVDRAASAGDSSRLAVLATELRRCFEVTAAQLSGHTPGEHRALR